MGYRVTANIMVLEPLYNSGECEDSHIGSENPTDSWT